MTAELSDDALVGVLSEYLTILQTHPTAEEMMDRILTSAFETGFIDGFLWKGLDGLRDFLSQRDGFFDERHEIEDLLEREATCAGSREDLRDDEGAMRADEERDLHLVRAPDAIDLDALRNGGDTAGDGVSLAQALRVPLVPRSREQDLDRKPPPLDVAVEVLEKLVLLAGREQGIDQDGCVRRFVVDTADLRRHRRAPVGPVGRVRMSRAPDPEPVV